MFHGEIKKTIHCCNLMVPMQREVKEIKKEFQVKQIAVFEVDT